MWRHTVIDGSVKDKYLKTIETPPPSWSSPQDGNIYSDAPSSVTSKLNTWSESSNKRATLSGVAKITLEVRRFRWNVEFQEKIFKLEIESSILVEIRNSDECNLCFIEHLFIYLLCGAWSLFPCLKSIKPVSFSHRTRHRSTTFRVFPFQTC